MAQSAPIEVYLTVSGGREAVHFYKQAFGAEVLMEQASEDGLGLLHASLAMFGGQIMLSDEPQVDGVKIASPSTLGASTVTIHINLETPADVDRVMREAVAHGATVMKSAENTMWGAYSGRLVDPFGHAWSFAAPAE